MISLAMVLKFSFLGYMLGILFSVNYLLMFMDFLNRELIKKKVEHISNPNDCNFFLYFLFFPFKLGREKG